MLADVRYRAGEAGQCGVGVVQALGWHRAILVGSQFATRHGLALLQDRTCAVAQAFVLSLWQPMQGLGTPEVSVSTGERKRKVCADTKMSPSCLLPSV